MRYLFWALVLVVAVLCADFAVSNGQAVGLAFWPLPAGVEAPLYLVVLAALVAGFLIGRIAGWLAGRTARRERRRQARRLQALEAELGRMHGDAVGPAARAPGRSLVS